MVAIIICFLNQVITEVYISAHLKWPLPYTVSYILVKECIFTHNNESYGAVIYAECDILLIMNSSMVMANNKATKYATVYLKESVKQTSWEVVHAEVQ